MSITNPIPDVDLGNYKTWPAFSGASTPDTFHQDRRAEFTSKIRDIVLQFPHAAGYDRTNPLI
jgi:hypothetical protein